MNNLTNIDIISEKQVVDFENQLLDLIISHDLPPRLVIAVLEITKQKIVLSEIDDE